MLDEKFVRDQIFNQDDFSSSYMIFSFLLFLRSVKPIQHFIQHGICVLLDEMMNRFNKVFTNIMLQELPAETSDKSFENSEMGIVKSQIFIKDSD